MQAWAVPEPAALPAVSTGSWQDRPLRLYDTAAGKVRPTAPDATVTLYVCGITPYDATHAGHAATYVAFDLLHRGWRDAGHSVRYVQNVTDVDDPLLQRADETGEDWAGLAERETAVFREDMAALNVLPPTEFVGAVEAIPLIAAAIDKLRTLGAAYTVDDDIYFSVHADAHFGSVGHLDSSTMHRLFAERGGDPERPGKRDPLDCLLWRAARPGEPVWSTPLGPGRPGWHIECAAIALHHLGDPVDVQGGGSDLVFPHHEMGAAEAQVLTGRWPYARHYVHAGMVGLDGEKMSKSRGNLVFVSKLRADHDSAAVRLALLAHHYREDWEWRQADVEAAAARLDRWRAAARLPTGPRAEGVLDEVRRHLADDLDAPRALDAVDRWVAEQASVGGPDQDAPTLVSRTVDALLGVRL